MHGQILLATARYDGAVVRIDVRAHVCDGEYLRERNSNLNQFYGGANGSPMVIIELLLMRSMYSNRRWNVAILAASAVAMLAFWVGIHEQVAITDREFLKSMIPHHAGVIIMCEKAEPKTPEIRELYSAIISSQQGEIAQMKGLLSKGG
jgi:uncharacterized protein (DUF305 family)